MRIERFGLRLKLGKDVECVNVLDDPRYRDTWNEYYQLARRKGVSRSLAQAEVRTRTTLIGAVLVRKGDADAMLCGTVGVLPGPPEVRPDRDRPAPGRAHVRGDAAADPAEPPAVHLRHARQRGSDRGAGRRDDDARGRRGAPLRTRAERGAAVALELRQLRPAVRGEDARGARADPRAQAVVRRRRRDAGGHGAVARDPGELDARTRR